MPPQKLDLIGGVYKKSKSKGSLRVKGIIGSGMLLLIVILQSVLSMPDVVIASGNGERINQRATLPPEWTATSTIAPTITVVRTPLPTITLGGQATATTVPASLDISGINGKQVIVDVEFLSVYTDASKDATIIDYLPRGVVRTIVTERQNPATHETWWYIFDSFGWIPAKIDGLPTVRDYSPDILNQMIVETNSAIQTDSQNVMLYLQLGWMYASQSKYESAISEITKGINIASASADVDPKTYARLLFYRGKFYLAEQNNMKALKDLDEAIELGFQEAVVYGRRATANQRLHQYAQARFDLLESMRLNPDYAATYSNLGSLIGQLNPNDPLQLDYFNKAIEIEPYFPYGYSNRAGYYMIIGDVGDHVIADLTTTLQLVPHDKQALNNRGIAHSRRQEFTLAIKDFDLVIDLYPDDADGYTNRGITYSNLGEIQDALKDLEYAVKLGDTSGAAYYNLGVLLNNHGQYLAALYCYNKAIEINPYRNDARINRSNILRLHRDVDEKAIMASPNFQALVTPTP